MGMTKVKGGSMRRVPDMSQPPEQRRRARKGTTGRKGVPAQMHHGQTRRARQLRKRGETMLRRQRAAGLFTGPGNPYPQRPPYEGRKFSAGTAVFAVPESAFL